MLLRGVFRTRQPLATAAVEKQDGTGSGDLGHKGIAARTGRLSFATLHPGMAET